MKPALRALLFLVLLTLCAMVMAIFTEQGTRSVIRILEQVLPLQIDYASGSLGDRLKLERLRYENAETHIELNDLEMELEPVCLLRSAICFRYLHAQHLDVAILADSAELEDSGQKTGGAVAERLVFPVIVEADHFEIEALRVHWGDGQWQQSSMQGSIRIHDSIIEVPRGTIVEPRLVLHDTDSIDPSDFGDTVMPNIELPFELLVHSLTLTRPAWDFYGNEFHQRSIVLSGSWVNHVLSLTQLDVDDSEYGELSLQGGLEFKGDWPLHANANIQLASALSVPDLFGQNFALAAQGDFASIAIQLTGRGAVAALVEANINVLDSELPFGATLTATSTSALRLLDLEDVPEFLSDVELVFPITASAEGTLASQQFTLNAGASGLGYESLKVSLAGRHESDIIEIAELSLRESTTENALNASGSVILRDGVEWSLALYSPGLNFPELMESVHGRIDGSLKFSGAMQGEEWRARVDDVLLQGDINGMPAHVSGFAGLNSQLQLSSSEVQAELNSAKLSLEVDDGDRQPGRLTLSIDDIGRWLPDSRGQLAINALVSSDRQHIQLSGNARDILWQGVQLNSGTIAADYQADAEYAFTLDATLDDISVSDIELKSMVLSAKGDAARQSVSLVSEGDLQGELSMTSAVQDGQWNGVLAPTELQTPVGLWRLSEALGLVWSDDNRQLGLDGHCWSHEHAQLCPEPWLLGPNGGGSFDLSGDMDLFAGFLPPGLDLEGSMQSELEISWKENGEFIAEGKIQTDRLTFVQHLADGESATFGWDSSTASFKYNPNGLHLDWRLQLDGRNVTELSIQLPPVREDAISGRIRFDRLQLTMLAPFLPALSALSGDVTGELVLSGTVDQPLARGCLQLSDGRMLMAGNPTELDKLNIKLDVQGDRAQIQGTGSLGGGELVLSGQVKTQPELRLELTVEGSRHTILYPPSTELRLSENLQLVMASDLLDIRGEVTVHKGLLEVQQLPEDSVSISSSVVEVDPDGNVLREELPFATRMNVRIRLEDEFKVTGNGFQTTLGGDLEVKQSPGLPLQLFGNLRTMGGELYAYQSHLKIMRGTINFSGPPTNPTLDLSAERHISAGNVTVGVRVQGPLNSDLELSLYSDPTMSQNDTLSYLVRGRGMDVGAGGDGTALALSLASGVINRSTLVAELNRIPGINNVSFGAQGSENDTAATVSGYIGERIYLSYGIGFYEPINVLTARFYLRSRIWLEVISSLENSVDLYYSFDIE